MGLLMGSGYEVRISHNLPPVVHCARRTSVTAQRAKIRGEAVTP
jgi:hypothetical protein